MELFIITIRATQIILPQVVGNAINLAIGAKLNGEVPCTVAKSGPDVIFTINGDKYTVPSSIYVRQRGNGVKCESGFSSNADQLGIIIFGAVFHRAFYTIYSRVNGTSSIGWAKAVHPAQKFTNVGDSTLETLNESSNAVSIGIIIVLVLVGLAGISFVISILFKFYKKEGLAQNIIPSLLSSGERMVDTKGDSASNWVSIQQPEPAVSRTPLSKYLEFSLPNWPFGKKNIPYVETIPPYVETIPPYAETILELNLPELEEGWLTGQLPTSNQPSQILERELQEGKRKRMKPILHLLVTNTRNLA
jgi:hypothetical protein